MHPKGDKPETDDLAFLGPRIKRARNEAGLTLEQVASALGVARQNVSAWESGKKGLRLDRLPAIARLTCKPLVWFFQEADAEAPAPTEEPAPAPPPPSPSLEARLAALEAALARLEEGQVVVVDRLAERIADYHERLRAAFAEGQDRLKDTVVEGHERLAEGQQQIAHHLAQMAGPQADEGHAAEAGENYLSSTQEIPRLDIERKLRDARRNAEVKALGDQIRQGLAASAEPGMTPTMEDMEVAIRLAAETYLDPDDPEGPGWRPVP